MNVGRVKESVAYLVGIIDGLIANSKVGGSGMAGDLITAVHKEHETIVHELDSYVVSKTLTIPTGKEIKETFEKLKEGLPKANDPYFTKIAAEMTRQEKAEHERTESKKKLEEAMTEHYNKKPLL